MNTLNLSSDSRTQLAWQVSQNGTFPHSLRTDNGLRCATAYVVVEQCACAVSVRVELGDSVNTITLTDGKDTAERVALFLEELANGVSLSNVLEVDEYLLVSDMEAVLRDAVRLRKGMTIAISELDEHLLTQGIAGWRGANADIDTAIESENWCAIDSAQNDRSLHANTIASIVHKYADTTAEQGARP